MTGRNLLITVVISVVYFWNNIVHSFWVCIVSNWLDKVRKTYLWCLQIGFIYVDNGVSLWYNKARSDVYASVC